MNINRLTQKKGGNLLEFSAFLFLCVICFPLHYVPYIFCFKLINNPFFTLIFIFSKRCLYILSLTN